MNNQKKVKSLISLAILIIVTLFVVVTIQLVNIIKIKNNLNSQNQRINQLEQQLDYYENKNVENNHEGIVLGENKW